MNATVETLDFEADALAVANANVPAIVGRPFEYSDIGAQAVPWAIYKDPAAAIAAASTTATPNQRKPLRRISARWARAAVTSLIA